METEYFYPYNSPTPRHIPLVASSINNSSSDITTPEQFEELLECGMNVSPRTITINSSTDIITLKNAIGYKSASSAKLDGTGEFNSVPNYRLLLFNGSLTTDEVNNGSVSTPAGLRTYISRFKSYVDRFFCPNGDAYAYKSAVAGWSLWDEPSRSSMLNLRAGSELWIYIALWSQSGLYSPLMFINLVGIERFYSFAEKGADKNLQNDLSFKDTEGYKKFIEYLNTYSNLFMPAYWSWDCYPVLEYNYMLNSSPFPEGMTTEEFVSLNGSYASFKYNPFYINFEIFRKRSQESDRPFWAYCLTVEHLIRQTKKKEEDSTEKVYGGGYYPFAREEFLRYEAFTALAYGAKGLVFWRWRPGGDSFASKIKEESNEMLCFTSTETYFTSPVSYEGRKSAVYYYVQRVTNEIKKYEQLFLESEVCGLFHVGDIPLLSSEMAEPYEILDRIEIPDGSRGVMVSFLKSDSVMLPEREKQAKDKLPQRTLHYMVLVNHSFTEYQNLTMHFNADVVGAELKELTPLRSGEEGVGSLNFNLNITLKLKRLLPPGGYRIFAYMA